MNPLSKSDTVEHYQAMAGQARPPKPTDAELLQVLKDLTFIAESVAHLRGLEAEILPTTEKARRIIARSEQS